MEIVTIGIPVYNEEKYLAETIKSVLHQTYKDIRIIISDNCSTDNSYSIAQQYAEDPRIKYISHPKNIGAVNNFKDILSICETPYFMWLGGHDILEKNFINSAVQILDNERNVALVYSKAMLIDTNDRVIDNHFYDDIDTVGLSFENGLLKVANNLFNCFSIHGLFRADLLNKCTIWNTIALDHTLLFCVASLGDIKLLDKYCLRCRKVRNEKSLGQTVQRLRNQGVDISLDTVLPYHTPMVVKHLESIWKFERIPFYTKIKISYRIQRIFSRRFGVSCKAIFLHKIKYLVGLLLTAHRDVKGKNSF